MHGGKRAAFVAVGSELLRADRLDTNSLLATRLLASCGYTFVEKRCVEDNLSAIGTAIRELLGRTELVVVSGGLGPTADDVTREAVSHEFGLELVRVAALEEALAARYQRLGRSLPEIARRMADVISGAEILPNPQGTAPGQLLATGNGLVLLLPGVPSEFETILRTHLLPRWRGQGGVLLRTLHLAGVYESQVEERVAPLYARFGRERVTILAARGRVDLLLQASGPQAAAELAEMEEAFLAVVGEDVFGYDEDTLPAAVLAHLRGRGWRVAVAESCTGGALASALVGVPGASDAFLGGVIAYDNCLKQQLLAVPAEVLERCGAVSGEVAEAMARGAQRLGAECGVGITGIAGPAGGSEEKPVGTVHMAVATPQLLRQAHLRFPGDRAMVRELAVNFALDLLRRAVEVP
ncbi:MAG: CinA family nicotinamide mononucleotide deamidase-related protein [Thermoanaerobaculaceae bacterium]|nr:CinA family nicotinamide mononucleotide deamidase-related protein [Thermoanaerobaculaceae bacterium]